MLQKTNKAKAKASAKKKPASAVARMAAYRRRMRAQGLRPVQLWMPDTKSPEYIAESRRQARALAASDPGGDKIMQEIEAGGYKEWPEYEW